MKAPLAMSDSLLTVEQCAERLKLHAKTVLRFIREGRIKAVKVGRAYRIASAEIEKMLGEPAAPAFPVRGPRTTSIVDADGVSPELAQKIARLLPAVRMGREAQGEPMNIDVVFDPTRAHLKIVLAGSPKDVGDLLPLIDTLLRG
jgi:excisionase family DNA binding protein